MYVGIYLNLNKKLNWESLTRKLHELVEVDDGEDGFPEFPEVELEDAGDGVDVGRVGHVGQRVLAAFERVSEVVDLHLWRKNCIFF